MVNLDAGEMRGNLYEIDRKMDTLRGRLETADAMSDFQDKVVLSWIYHENALEGIVLTQEEILAALDNEPVPDISLAPVYEEVRCHRRAIDTIRSLAERRRLALDLTLIKKLHQLFYENNPNKLGGKYRKDMPIHRLYFHEICPPDKIAYKMRQLFDWADTQEAKKMHPVRLAANLHYQLMRTYPFAQYSGKLSRLIMNYVIIQAGYVPAIIHAVERQRYYESLRAPLASSMGLVVEALDNAIESANRLFAPHSMERAAF